VPTVLTDVIHTIIDKSRKAGWVLEPDAKRLMAEVGIPVPKFEWCHELEDALAAAERIGYPLVAKIVSTAVMHKTDVDGVVVGIRGPEELENQFQRLSRLQAFDGVLLDEMVTGYELIVGCKNDFQFGPVVLLGIGGTSVEIYQDTAVRMAPLKDSDPDAMVASLRGRRLLRGYRGRTPISIPHLTRVMLKVSELMMALQDRIESLDLNPVFCSDQHCIVADARIILK
jgi:succinyl-CoA synthetase beta subunit